jgi:hypothetical protein
MDSDAKTDMSLLSLAKAAFPERFLRKRLAKQFDWVFEKMSREVKQPYSLKIVHLLCQSNGLLKQGLYSIEITPIPGANDLFKTGD